MWLTSKLENHKRNMATFLYSRVEVVAYHYDNSQKCIKVYFPGYYPYTKFKKVFFSKRLFLQIFKYLFLLRKRQCLFNIIWCPNLH